MSPNRFYFGFLTGAVLFAAHAVPARGQDAPPAEPGPADPGLFGPARPPTPWYADAEIAVLFTTAVHFRGQFATVRDDNPVFVSPRVFLGRRLADGGAVRFTYRNLTELGRLGPAEGPDGDWASGDTFTTHWFDLDYVSREYAPLSWWRLQAEFGGRLVYGRIASWYRTPDARTDSSETYFGGGPHAGLTSHWLLGRSGWALYARADTAVTFGRTETTNRHQPLQPDEAWWDPPQSDRASRGAYQFDLGLELGLAKRGLWRGLALGLVTGVQADVLTRGSTGGEFDASGVVNAGPFLRAEVGF